MTVRVAPKLSLLAPTSLRLLGPGLAAALLTAGCGVATPGPADYAGGPVSDSPTYLNAFPMPDTYVGGASSKEYTNIVNVTTGTGPRNFTITVGADLILWLGCGGTAGSATLTSPDIGLNWSVACATSGDPQGVEFKTKQDVGQSVKILVTAPAAARWEVRIDAPANQRPAAAPSASPSSPSAPSSASASASPPASASASASPSPSLAPSASPSAS